MALHVFFSWQTDTPNSVGRTFLRQVLEEVCKELASDSEVDEAMRDLKVDSDTQGVAGQPPIAETILKKIDDAAVFVSDMTFVAARIDGRPSPNPNVLIEYGWALKSLGHSRVLSVMNTAFGVPTAENMPFDLAHLRWPMRYELPADAPPELRSAERKKLKRVMKEAIQACLATIPKQPQELPPIFPEAAAKDGPARFRGPGEALGFDEDDIRAGNREVFLSAGAAMWLRLMPVTNPNRLWKISDLKTAGSENSNLFPIFTPAGGYSYVRASDGFGVYHVSAGEQSGAPVSQIGFAFRTGEAWAIDTALLAYGKDRLFYSDIETGLVKAVGRYRRFLQALGISGPYRWRAGLTQIKGRQLGYPPRPGHMWVRERGPICAADEIEAEGVLAEEQGALEALQPFFERLFEECGVDLPDYLPKQ